MRKIYYILSITLLACLLNACGGDDDSAANNNDFYAQWSADTALVKMAVMPTLDCLPIYVAADHGMFERHGASVSLYTCDAQMDCDTAFKGGWVGAMATDLVRAERLKEQGMNLDYLTATDLNWQLLSSRSSRVKRLSQMEDKMVAMTRYSATAMLADELVDTSGVVNEHVFRIQVNSIFVRLSMLETQVMDLLLLPEPQATVARNMESPVLYDTRWNNVSMGVVVMNDTTIADATLRKSQREAFLNAYNEACDSLNELGLKRYRDIIMKRCRVTPAVVDSLSSDIQFTPAHQPFQQDVDRAVKWLNMQY
jgi:NitT/TauT family transport system substrate-binding protein